MNNSNNIQIALAELSGGSAAKEVALRLLSSREHSGKELRQKLLKRKFSEELVSLVVELSGLEGWHDDLRYAGCLIRKRVDQGYGYNRILSELLAKGVSEADAREALSDESPDWQAVAEKSLAKKYSGIPDDYKEKQRRQRFLLQRGFSYEIISRLI